MQGGHERSVRCADWAPNGAKDAPRLVTGSFDSTAAIWRYKGSAPDDDDDEDIEVDYTRGTRSSSNNTDEERWGKDWAFTLVLEGQEAEIKSSVFSPSGTFLANCSRDKSIWIWEDIGQHEEEDEWEVVAVLQEHQGDVKSASWCPTLPARNKRGRDDVLASASYDNTVRIYREDGDGDWVCVSVLEGHTETVWGVTWERRPAEGCFPRILTFSADGTIRVWRLVDDEDEEMMDEAGPRGPRGGMGGMPNTMRRSLTEQWECVNELPRVHTGDVYSVCWSSKTGLVASTGSDGIIAVYSEVETDQPSPSHDSEAAEGTDEKEDTEKVPEKSREWKVITKTEAAHGPYEVNHITWCPRFDSVLPKNEGEEMLVTTGDDGTVRPWRVEI